MFDFEKVCLLLGHRDLGPKLGATSGEVDKAMKTEIVTNAQLMQIIVQQPEEVVVTEMIESAGGVSIAIAKEDREPCGCLPCAS